MSKSIDTLIEDIYTKVDEGFDVDEKYLTSLLDDIESSVLRQMEPDKRQNKNTLRMSNIGKDECELWHEVNGTEGEKLHPQTRLKFLFGDFVEALLLFLAKSAGHEVTHEQHQIKVNDIVGHMDCEIDGVPTDIKSTTSRGLKKFKEGTLAEDDPFGYMAQISGYTTAREKNEGAFFAMGKENAELAVMKVPEMDIVNVEVRIDHLKKVVSSDTPPERCHNPVPDGKSGNMKLGVKCSYCSFKEPCWSDTNDGKGLRKFIYSNGPRWLTTVEREPDVYEVTKEVK